MFNNHHTHDRGRCGTSGRRYAGDRLRDAGARWVRGRSLLLLLAVLALALGAQAAAADPVGQVSEFSSGLNAGSYPALIAPGADGNLWFTDAGTTRRSGGSPRAGRSPSSPRPERRAAAGRDRAGTGRQPVVHRPRNDRAIGRITPSGQITEFTAGLNTGSVPVGIAAGSGRQLWFTDDGDDQGDRADHPERADHRVHQPA